MPPRNLALCVLAVILGYTLSAQVPSTSASSGQVPERLSADTPKSTVLGNAFIAPKGWSLSVKRRATILEAPEGNSWIALVDVDANGPEQALAAAWQVYNPEAKWPVKVSTDLPKRDGWSRRRRYEYLTLPNEKRGVAALVSYSGSSWTVVIEDLADAVAEKRGSQVALSLGRLLPKGLQQRAVRR